MSCVTLEDAAIDPQFLVDQSSEVRKIIQEVLRNDFPGVSGFFGESLRPVLICIEQLLAVEHMYHYSTMFASSYEGELIVLDDSDGFRPMQNDEVVCDRVATPADAMAFSVGCGSLERHVNPQDCQPPVAAVACMTAGNAIHID